MSLQHNTRDDYINDLIDKLPIFIQKAIISYEKFCTHDAWDDPRSYGVHHTACRAALSHLDILLRIESGLRTAYAPTDRSLTTDIQSLLTRANAEIEGSDSATLPTEPRHIPRLDVDS